ncbi:LytTR family DNA-binding domain-containing protein [Arcanobacterium pinnipediorum]|uniref:LytTR family transcriptional regulator n=1 Tax=Arcanobacterium pinnipediorum TaxID=1503041 RepID=A0ABY5AFK9_9ACTO|nr:LytTR family DNA-binding domain-containing protein [Arcanobacterium pinnipediorum]USR78790.1 LytTR family transcriptional regulator [Arcanobacterium pinnipediorum]
MKFSLTIDHTLDEATVDVTTPFIDATVTAIEELARGTKNSDGANVIGVRDNEAHIFTPQECFAFFTKDRSVWVSTDLGYWQVKKRLYELESGLPRTSFIRISQSEIVNIAAISHLDFSVTGTIRVHLHNGMHFFVSRRQLSAFKRSLGI